MVCFESCSDEQFQIYHLFHVVMLIVFVFSGVSVFNSTPECLKPFSYLMQNITRKKNVLVRTAIRDQITLIISVVNFWYLHAVQWDRRDLRIDTGEARGFKLCCQPIWLFFFKYTFPRECRNCISVKASPFYLFS